MNTAIAGGLSFSMALVLALQGPPQRIISLVPAVTEMLFAIGAGPQVAAVSSYDKDPPEVEALPRVGALLDPDVERIFSLRPDLVVTYGSQADLKTQLARASIPVFDYRHGTLGDITETMRRLGERTGHAREADEAATAIERQLDEIRAGTQSGARPRTLLVFGRDPGALRNVYASGGRGFLHDMLETAGGTNVLADIDRESVQVTTEVILARAPEVILEVRSGDDWSEEQAAREATTWDTLASVPAVRQKRVIVLTGRGLTVPGPRVASVVAQLADALRSNGPLALARIIHARSGSVNNAPAERSFCRLRLGAGAPRSGLALSGGPLSQPESKPEGRTIPGLVNSSG